MFVKTLRNSLLTIVLLVSSTSLIRERLATDTVSAATLQDNNASALGRAYGPLLARTYAEGWIAAAKALEQGKSVEESQKELQQTWQEARNKAFRARLLPAFRKVLPEGVEPVDALERERVATFWRSFAAGLRGDN